MSVLLKEELKEIFEPVQENEPIRFIAKQHNDKHAAAQRYAAIEELLISWYTQVNNTNTRAMPSDLIVLYDAACQILLKIKDRERSIILEGRK